MLGSKAGFVTNDDFIFIVVTCNIIMDDNSINSHKIANDDNMKYMQ